jgi:predicted acyltransferase
MTQVVTIAAVTIAILFGYWLMLTGMGDLTPEGNIGAAIDRRLFGSHLYRSGRWDPEGLLSSVPAVATTLLGVLAGMWIGAAAPLDRKVRVLAGAGVVMMIVGQIWGVWLPVNKNLWTSSYVVLTAGAAAIVLAACLYAIDLRGWRRWSQPFVVFGMNAIALFVISGLIGRILIVWSLQEPIYQYGFAWMASPKNASLLYSLAFLAAMYVMCEGLYRRRIFLKA